MNKYILTTEKDNYNKEHYLIRDVINDYEYNGNKVHIMSFYTDTNFNEKLEILDFIKEAIIQKDKELSESAMH